MVIIEKEKSYETSKEEIRKMGLNVFWVAIALIGITALIIWGSLEVVRENNKPDVLENKVKLKEIEYKEINTDALLEKKYIETPIWISSKIDIVLNEELKKLLNVSESVWVPTKKPDCIKIDFYYELATTILAKKYPNYYTKEYRGDMSFFSSRPIYTCIIYSKPGIVVGIGEHRYFLSTSHMEWDIPNKKRAFILAFLNTGREYGQELAQ